MDSPSPWPSPVGRGKVNIELVPRPTWGEGARRAVRVGEDEVTRLKEKQEWQQLRNHDLDVIVVCGYLFPAFRWFPEQISEHGGAWITVIRTLWWWRFPSFGAGHACYFIWRFRDREKGSNLHPWSASWKSFDVINCTVS